MKTIQLSRGLSTKLDDEDFESFYIFDWYALKGRNNFYAVRSIGRGTKYLHREIMSAPCGYDVDHINHDTLDNRKSNLRICLHAENLRNRLGEFAGAI